MAGIKEQVKGFIEVWAKRKSGALPPLGVTVRCHDCGVVLEDGNFALIDGNLTCLNCMEGLQEK
jgi:transposase